MGFTPFGGLYLGSSYYGSKPVVPQWQDVSLGGAQSAAIGSNLSALPAASALTGQTNAITQQQLTEAMNQAFPGFSNVLNKGSGVIQSELAGQIPEDVQNQIFASTASRAAAGGFAGTGQANALTARDLGTTSLALQQQGMNSANSWASLAKNYAVGPQANVASMFVSPQQQYQSDYQNAVNQWQTQWLSNQTAAAQFASKHFGGSGWCCK